MTHCLIGAGAARLLCPRRPWLGQISLAALLASLLPDGDSWLALLGPEMYGLHHREASHCLVGLSVLALFAALLAWLAAGVAPWRRFGWFVSDNLPRGGAPARVPFARLLAVAAVAAALHWTADVITGFGNMEPFWPWSHRDFSLRAVSSFDGVIFSSTLAWHVVLRRLDWPRRREALLTGAWALALAFYVAGRWMWGQPSII